MPLKHPSPAGFLLNRLHFFVWGQVPIEGHAPQTPPALRAFCLTACIFLSGDRSPLRGMPLKHPSPAGFRRKACLWRLLMLCRAIGFPPEGHPPHISPSRRILRSGERNKECGSFLSSRGFFSFRAISCDERKTTVFLFLSPQNRHSARYSNRHLPQIRHSTRHSDQHSPQVQHPARNSSAAFKANLAFPGTPRDFYQICFYMSCTAGTYFERAGMDCRYNFVSLADK